MLNLYALLRIFRMLRHSNEKLDWRLKIIPLGFVTVLKSCSKETWDRAGRELESLLRAGVSERPVEELDVDVLRREVQEERSRLESDSLGGIHGAAVDFAAMIRVLHHRPSNTTDHL